MFPFCNQVDIHERGPVIVREERAWDEVGYETTQQRIGATQCPRCRLWWPEIQEPDAWTFNEDNDLWDANDWWGGVVCELCGLLMVEQPDGTREAYELDGYDG